VFLLSVAFLQSSFAQVIIDSTNVDELEKPGFAESDLNCSLPQMQSLFKGFFIPDNYEEIKENFYEKTRLKYSVSYQGIAMQATSVVDDGLKDYAAAGFFLAQLEYTPLNFGKDYQGQLVVSFNNIHNYGDAAAAPLFFINTGSMFAHDALFLDVDPFFSSLYWEQWFEKDRFFMRIGQHVPAGMIDFTRFADVQTSVSNPAIGFPANVIPFGPPALGLSAKWLSDVKPSGYYAVAHISDINSVVDELNFANLFETGDFFAAGEFGYNWVRMGDYGPELDHLHLLVFGSTESSRRMFPTKSGWGFKVPWEKQVGKWVGLLNYTYNNAVGGGFGFTSLEQVVNLGTA